MRSPTKFLFPSLTSLFAILLAFRLIIVFLHPETFALSKFYPHVLVIVILNQKNRITWALGMIFFIYGLYYYLFISASIAYPSEIEFTLPVVELFFSNKGGFSNLNFGVRFILWIPLFFYLGMIIFFLTVKTRKMYSAANL